MNWSKIFSGAGSGAASGAVSGGPLAPWTTLAGGIIGAGGAILSAQEEEEQRKRDEAFRNKQFDWQQKTDRKNQFNSDRQLGQNAIQMMRGSFKDALYRSLTRG